MAMTFEQFVELIRNQTILTGDGVPSAALGNDFDYYVDQLARRFYRKIDGTWSSSAENVLGPYFFNLSVDQYDALIAAVIDQAITDAADQAVAAAQAQIADDVAAADNAAAAAVAAAAASAQSKTGAETAQEAAETAQTAAESAAGTAIAAANVIGSVVSGGISGRLTLTSGVAVTTSDVTAATSVYFTPHNGNSLWLYTADVWKLYAFTERTLFIAGYAANTNFDLFLHDADGTITMTSAAWASDSSRGYTLAYQDGILVKPGEANKRYIGTIRTTAVAGQCEDSSTKRFVWNQYNRVARLGMTYNSTASWTYSTAAWREYNGGTGQIKFQFVCGEQIVLNLNNSLFATTSSTAITGYVCVTLDSTTSGVLTRRVNFSSTTTDGKSNQYVVAGYHYCSLCEYVNGASMTVYGGSGNSYDGQINIQG